MSEILEYKCPCCGGAIEFNSSIQKMKCPYCDSEFEMDSLKAYDDVLKEEAEVEDSAEWDLSSKDAFSEDENINTYVCKSCGGEVITESTVVATNCPYCDNPIVLAKRVAGELKPDYVIPFKLTKEDAKKAFREHLKGKRLLPKVFKDENHIDEIKSLYVPFWLFDADVKAKARYKASRIRTWSMGDYRYTETSYYSLLREGEMGFERIPVDGSDKMPDDLMESIEPYNFSEAVDFQTAYLAGYLANRYDVSVEESILRANSRMKNSSEEKLRETTTGYTTVTAERNNIQLSNQNSKYALYPVWILNTTYQGKKYVFAMNGQTGQFVGDLPLDKGAYWRWLLGLFVGLGVVAVGLAKLLAVLF